jgi:hypothetical protein
VTEAGPASPRTAEKAVKKVLQQPILKGEELFVRRAKYLATNYGPV